MNGKQKLTCGDTEKRVKNDQKTGVQKGSKMAKNEGPKKGQKVPKIDFFELSKNDSRKKKLMKNNNSVNRLIYKTYKQKRDITR
jgi:hypothetical protein